MPDKKCFLLRLSVAWFNFSRIISYFCNQRLSDRNAKQKLPLLKGQEIMVKKTKKNYREQDHQQISFFP